MRYGAFKMKTIHCDFVGCIFLLHCVDTKDYLWYSFKISLQRLWIGSQEFGEHATPRIFYIGKTVSLMPIFSNAVYLFLAVVNRQACWLTKARLSGFDRPILILSSCSIVRYLASTIAISRPRNAAWIVLYCLRKLIEVYLYMFGKTPRLVHPSSLPERIVSKNLFSKLLLFLF